MLPAMEHPPYLTARRSAVRPTRPTAAAS